MTTMTTVETVGELGQRLSGAVLTPVSPGCDEVRRVHNGLVDKHPAVIARCLNNADVVDAVTFGRERGLELSVQAPRSTSASGRQGSAGEASKASTAVPTHPPSRAAGELSSRPPRALRLPYGSLRGRTTRSAGGKVAHRRQVA